MTGTGASKTYFSRAQSSVLIWERINSEHSQWLGQGSTSFSSSEIRLQSSQVILHSQYSYFKTFYLLVQKVFLLGEGLKESKCVENNQVELCPPAVIRNVKLSEYKGHSSRKWACGAVLLLFCVFPLELQRKIFTLKACVVLTNLMPSWKPQMIRVWRRNTAVLEFHGEDGCVGKGISWYLTRTLVT